MSEWDLAAFCVSFFGGSEVDSYFSSFGFHLHWATLRMCGVQCKLVGKAQEVCSVLRTEKSLDYDVG